MLFICFAYFVVTSSAFAYFFYRHMTNKLTDAKREAIRLRLRVQSLEAKWADLESVRLAQQSQQNQIAALQLRMR